MEAARAGDGAALEALLRVARPQIRRHAERWCIAQMAEDATQEAMVTLWRRLPALRSVAALPMWLVRTVARICMGLVSPFWRRIEALQDEEAESTRPEDVELKLDLERAIAALPGTYRDAIVLFYVSEQPVADVAARLGITAEATRVRLHRGRALIRERLTGKTTDEGAA
ncbi:MAG TPA: sigma-70 family RNA polymerase sigma factor [Xanthomonadales bacterium]|nr:sigma-70 family RNA polymerase sigma factor [Xanthomonadales bacterium]